MKRILLSILSLLFFTLNTTAQQNQNTTSKPYFIGKPDKIVKVPSLASRMATLPRPDLSQEKEMLDGRSSKYDVVIGKGSEGDDVLAQNPHRLKNKIPGKTPELVFETGASGSQPTDPAGAVGPNHYISVINTAYQIFDKQGNSLTNGLVSPNPSIFTSGGCCDLTASYDNNADRWVLSFLGGGVQVAVSDGPDPFNDSWTVYTYTTVSDYQKLSVWHDGYYMTENTNSTNKLHVFERSAMIDAASAGTTPQILSFSLPGLTTSGFHSPQVLNISDNNWPTSGGATVVYMQDDAWTGVAEDHLKIWTATMDWDTPTNSQISTAVELGNAEGVTPFVSVFDGGSFTNLAQPNNGGSIDVLQATIMNQAQYRKFDTYNSAVFNFVVDVDGTATKQAGIRWYELRQTADGQPWTVHQEGTYTSPDNKHAWNASLIMDKQGNIGLGYTAMSSANSTVAGIFAGSYYTGRMANDPAGTMTVSETEIKAGNGTIPSNRYGDYSKIDIDPDGDKKFWFVNELMFDGRKNYAGVFQLAPNTNNDVGIISIDSPTSGTVSANEDIIVTIFNFGQNDATGFDVTYQIDGGTVITETYSGTLASQTSVQYTFTTKADLSTEGQTYAINSSTILTGDEDTSNDAKSVNVTHIFANDLGITEITSPTSGEVLGNETVVVTLKNFGAVSQSNFDVSYTINGGSQVTETIAGPLAAGATMTYSFNATGDFSQFGEYTINAFTNLTGDSVTTNNSSQITITNISCVTEDNMTQMPIGPNHDSPVAESIITVSNNFSISDVNVTINLEHTYVSDLDIKLVGPDGTEVILSTDNGGGDDNYTNTVFDDQATETIVNGTAPFTGTFKPEGNLTDFNGKSANGDWKLIIDDTSNGDGGNLLNWSLKICTDDSSLLVRKNNLEGNLTIADLGNNQYNINLSATTLTEKINLDVYNVMGQKLLWKTLENNGSGYNYKLNMDYAATGLYIIKLSDKSYSKTNSIKILVK